MPITDRSQAKKGGFAQVREALLKFKGEVIRAEFDRWGGKLVDEDGKPVPPKEFLEVESINLEALEVTEELSMGLEEGWSFRVNCSDFEGSFWVERFLASADKFKLLIPDDLAGKVITWEKVTLESFNRDGTPNPKYNSTNYVIVAVEGASPKKATPKVVDKAQPAQAIEEVAEPEAEVATGAADPMEAALTLAVGKTEAQFRTAVALDPHFVGSPLLPLAKAGVVTQSLVNDGKLVLVGTKYQLPG